MGRIVPLKQKEDFYLDKARELSEVGDNFPALKAINFGLIYYPESYELNMERAEILKSMGAISYSNEALISVITKYRGEEEPYVYLVHNLLKQKRIDDAFHYFNFCVENEIISSDIMQENFDVTAEEVFVPPLRVVAKDEDDMRLIADAFAKIERDDDTNLLEQLGEVAPTSSVYAMARAIMAIIYHGNDKLNEAVIEARTSLSSDKHNCLAYSVLVVALSKLNKKDESDIAFGQMLDENFVEVGDVLNVAKTAVQIDREETAHELLSTILDRVQYSKQVYYFAAITAYNCHKRSSAKRIIAQILVLNQNDTVAKYFSDYFMRKEFVPLDYNYVLPLDETRKRLRFIDKIVAKQVEDNTKIVMEFEKTQQDTTLSEAEKYKIVQGLAIKRAKHTLPTDEYARDCFEWAFSDGVDISLSKHLIALLASDVYYVDFVKRILLRESVDKLVKVAGAVALFLSLDIDYLDIMADGKLKILQPKIPKIATKLPEEFILSYYKAIAYVIFYEDDIEPVGKNFTLVMKALLEYNYVDNVRMEVVAAVVSSLTLHLDMPSERLCEDMECIDSEFWAVIDLVNKYNALKHKKKSKGKEDKPDSGDGENTEIEE